MLHTKEHIDLMKQFEKDYKFRQPAKEDKSLWLKGHIYQNGEINNLFKAYRAGYSLGKAIAAES